MRSPLAICAAAPVYGYTAGSDRQKFLGSMYSLEKSGVLAEIPPSLEN